MKKRNILRRVVAIVLLLCVKASPCAAFTYSNPTGDEFPILAWFSILPDEEQTPERYRELAEAGFNITFPHFSTLSQFIGVRMSMLVQKSVPSVGGWKLMSMAWMSSGVL